LHFRVLIRTFDFIEGTSVRKNSNIFGFSLTYSLIDDFVKKVRVLPFADSIDVYAKEKVRLKNAGKPLTIDH